ncbi:hypothetical protein QBC46DRAFT_153163 [Diplogelasinospora grovesii]|uniref:Uncharacterized protein n=1 Tax=Diplogelasinospora grovesii TaxID=303347 RepID=A0AAN6N667_9PEZI|nr:hypothetical protein QBC46DRAFT_153163 [Diplogelasinospora grovesii]
MEWGPGTREGGMTLAYIAYTTVSTTHSLSVFHLSNLFCLYGFPFNGFYMGIMMTKNVAYLTPHIGMKSLLGGFGWLVLVKKHRWMKQPSYFTIYHHHLALALARHKNIFGGTHTPTFQKKKKEKKT